MGANTPLDRGTVHAFTGPRAECTQVMMNHRSGNTGRCREGREHEIHIPAQGGGAVVIKDPVKITEGDVVIVGSGSHPRSWWIDRYVVTKVARMWITTLPEDQVGKANTQWCERRFRMDDQTDGSRIGAPARFYTLAQWAHAEREAEGDDFLISQGIRLDSGSPWFKRRGDLADIVRRALPPETS